MKTGDAESLIKPAFSKVKSFQRWADLGCGDGLFTLTLANNLAPCSKVYAVDRSARVLPQLNNVEIEFIQADFEKEPLPFHNLDGILMANSLHFVKDKTALIDRLIPYLNKDGRFIMVEYESNEANPWVPYPVTFKNLEMLFSGFGFTRITKLGERKSIYGPRMMYSCLAEK